MLRPNLFLWATLSLNVSAFSNCFHKMHPRDFNSHQAHRVPSQEGFYKKLHCWDFLMMLMESERTGMLSSSSPALIACIRFHSGNFMTDYYQDKKQLAPAADLCHCEKTASPCLGTVQFISLQCFCKRRDVLDWEVVLTSILVSLIFYYDVVTGRYS